MQCLCGAKKAKGCSFSHAKVGFSHCMCLICKMLDLLPESINLGCSMSLHLLLEREISSLLNSR